MRININAQAMDTDAYGRFTEPEEPFIRETTFAVADNGDVLIDVFGAAVSIPRNVFQNIVRCLDLISSQKEKMRELTGGICTIGATE